MHQSRGGGPGRLSDEGADGPGDPDRAGPVAADRPLLVAVHGLGSSPAFWDNLRPGLEPDFRVVTPTLPGHGMRPERLSVARAHPRELAAMLVDELRAEGVADAHLVGLSLGGWVILEMAALGYGKSVTALSPAGFWRPGTRIRTEKLDAALHLALRPFDRSLPTLLHSRILRTIGLTPNMIHHHKVTHQQFLEAAWALRDARSFSACDRACCRVPFEAGAKVAVPTLIAFGDHDRVLPAHSSQDRSRAPDHAEWRTVVSCGHAISWDQPEIALELIHATVARTAPALDE